MESEMSVEQRVENLLGFLSHADEHNRRDIAKCVLVAAEGRGYQRGKAEQVVPPRGVLKAVIDHNDECRKSISGIRSGVVNPDYAAGYASARDEAERAISLIPSNLFNQVAEQSVSSGWEDLKGLEGRALRERLRSRAHNFSWAARILSDRVHGTVAMASDKEDIQILIDLIQSKSQACEVEADRLWSLHLDSFEPLLDEPDGAAKIVAALGPNYLPVIVDRRAAKRAREAADAVCPTCQGAGCTMPGGVLWHCETCGDGRQEVS